ncbi:TPA: hypothetical protein JD203_02975 [Cronobacter sakazakii]|nr:hypothetical protein [Cronobacter sakazakii]
MKNKLIAWVVHVLFLGALAWGLFQPDSMVVSAAACFVYLLSFASVCLLMLGLFGYIVYAFCERGVVRPGSEAMPPLLCKMFGLDKPSSGWAAVRWVNNLVFVVAALLQSGWFATAVVYLLSVVLVRCMRWMLAELLKDWRAGAQSCPAA